MIDIGIIIASLRVPKVDMTVIILFIRPKSKIWLHYGDIVVSIMQPKELHDFLFKLYDFADEATTNPEVITPAEYKEGFLIAAYIEDFMDVYGRHLIHKAATEAGLDAEESVKTAHERIDRLRAELGSFENSSELQAMMDSATARLKRNYGSKE